MVALGSILDLRGAEFLRLYLLLLFIASLMAIVLRWLMRSPDADGDASTWSRDLDPYEIAYLTGGLSTASAAATATLVHRGMVDAGLSRLKANGGGALLNDLHPLERAVYSAIANNSFVTPRALREHVSALFRADRLESRELILSAGRIAMIRFASTLPLLIVLAIGGIKISVGVSRNRPVAFLVLLSLVTTVVAAIFFFRKLLRTRRGDAVVRAMQSDNAALRATASSRPKKLELDEVTMACALFGPMVFATAGDAEYRDVSRKFAPAHSGANSNSGGCGSTGCGTSGGGGGCGGGGCGGCGGSS